jgi:drug/metabolite transporter (DMT)-like permease
MTARVAPAAGGLDPRRGVLLMLAGLAVFAVLNGVVKDQASRFPVTQVILFRNAFGLLPLLLIAWTARPPEAIRVRPSLGHLAQTAFMSATLLASYTAFTLTTLADVTAIFFLQPILLTALATLLLGERGGWRVWAAVALGFLGVLVVVRPGEIGVGAGALLALAAAVGAAFAMLQQRALSATDSSMTIATSYMALSTLAFAPTALVWWRTPSPEDFLGLAAMGVASGLGQWLIIRPFFYAEASTLAPVQYANLLGAIVVGYLWFGETPSPATLVGAAIVASATLLVLRRGPARGGSAR